MIRADHSRRQQPASQQRGVATLLVVMGLFFLVSMVAAYTSRNLIFEQRTSANQYRATQAFEAAEAGLDWALAQLNSGRANATCAATTDLAFNTFRQRYVPELEVALASSPPGAPGCRLEKDNQWTCGCPEASAPVFPASEGQAVEPAFRVRFRDVAKPAPGFLTIESTGCTVAEDACLRDGSSRGAAGGAAALVSQLAALVPALATRPVAAVTVLGNLNASLRAINTDTTANGISVLYGNAISGVTSITSAGNAEPLAGQVRDPGMGPASVFFERHLGMAGTRFQEQPSTVSACGPATVGNCLTDVLEKATRNPGRPIWVIGELVIDQPVTLGSVDAPVLLVTKEKLTFSAADIQITGVVYSQGDIVANGASGLLRGALVAERTFTGTQAPDMLYDRAVIDKIRSSQGTIVRVPGGWKDF